MTRSKRTLYTQALDVLLRGTVAQVAHARDWELLREVAKLAQDDAPKSLVATDPALFRAWRNAVTRFHVAGWGQMTPQRVDAVLGKAASKDLGDEQAGLAPEALPSARSGLPGL